MKSLHPLDNKHYDASMVEAEIYERWKQADVFACDPSSKKPPYSIVIPPPNVTGRLHMGHALNNSIQDSLCRFKRMDGYDVLWVPGTDHAGISTQSVVKKHLDKDGIDFFSLGREEVIKRIWEWKEKYGNQILDQLEKIGCSCDWSKTRFTMDEGLSRAVRTAFKKFYDQGLIYRGKYIVNWCPVDRTALSDDEVNTKEGGEPGHLWHIRYPISSGEGFVTIATTRPETLLGDTAVAVNPKDERYQKLIGKTVTLPIVGRKIPIIADDYVDASFGSGCLKVTPAHDPNDFQIGVRHNLPAINVMNEDATMGDQAPEKFHGMDRYDCRKALVTELESLGLLEEVEDRMTPVGRAQRSGAVIEYRLSDQWFVKMKPLAEKALTASDNEEIHLFPERWDTIYRSWLENTRDWCISRQIWWGHQIPAWYHKETGEVLVEIDTPQQVLDNPDAWKQDEDVLDTWFSSALWPYSTMGWPESTDLLQKYYPTSVLSTAKDIIYFWVARMVMTGLNFMDEIPFRHVYFHPVICDAKGETMSKSKGNGIDPLHVINGASTEELEGPINDARPQNMEQMLEDIRKNYPDGFSAVGADALRITLLSLNSHAQQVQISLKKFDEVGKRFTDKLWNASRFALHNISSGPVSDSLEVSTLADRWIMGKLDQTIDTVRAGFEQYKFHESIQAILRFFWDDFCDWYLELSKADLKNESLAPAKRRVLLEAYKKTLALLHPFAPFITEELWSHLGEKLNMDLGLLASTNYPVSENNFDQNTQDEFEYIQNIVREIRNLKAQFGLASNTKIPVSVLCSSKTKLSILKTSSELLKQIAALDEVSFVTSKPEGQLSLPLAETEIFVNLSEMIDIEAEIKRNEKLSEKLQKELAGIQGRLQNKNFVSKAPEDIILETKAQAEALQARLSKVSDLISELSSASEQ